MPIFRHPPLLFFSQAGGDELNAQIAEILESSGVSPATLQELAGKLSLAQTFRFGKIARATRQSNSDVASSLILPAARMALVGRLYALSVRGLRVFRSISPSPDFILRVEAEGPGVCAALVSQARNKANGASLLKS